MSIASVKHRKLRIAWSVAWGIVATSLFLLWIRSYLISDVVSVSTHTSDVIADSVSGGTNISVFFDAERQVASEWHRESYRHNSAMHPPNATWKFNIRITCHGLDASVPHWFYLLFASFIAAAVWIRFSLRALMIGTTLIAAGLGLIVWLSR